VLALQYGLVPDAQRAGAAARLAADIRRRGGALSTGMMGTPHLLDVLADAGHASLVYDLLLRTGYPSWGHMIGLGATTMWERWNGEVGDVAMNSYNHYALGSVGGFLFRRLAGIDEVEPGFATFRFKPLLDARVGGGGADYDSVLGRISTRWSAPGNGRFALELQVPPNAQALVHLPATSASRVREGGRVLAASEEIMVLAHPAAGTASRPARDVAGEIRLRVRSGHYRFTVA